MFAIIWTNADPVQRRIDAALGGDDLTMGTYPDTCTNTAEYRISVIVVDVDVGDFHGVDDDDDIRVNKLYSRHTILYLLYLCILSPSIHSRRVSLHGHDVSQSVRNITPWWSYLHCIIHISEHIIVMIVYYCLLPCLFHRGDIFIIRLPQGQWSVNMGKYIKWIPYALIT